MIKLRSPYLHFSYDTGSGSMGWAVFLDDVHGNTLPHGILDCGVFTFPKGDDPTSNETLANKRGGKRRTRRLRRRHRSRLNGVIHLFLKNHLINEHQVHNFFNHDVTLKPLLELRYKGISHRLSMFDWFRICYYFCNHRGYHSVAKYALKGNGPMLKAIRHSKVQEVSYHTLGERLYLDSKLSHHTRNKNYDGNNQHALNPDNGFHIMPTRHAIKAEFRLLLRHQIKFWRPINNHTAQIMSKIANQYEDIAFSQHNYDIGPSSNSPYAGSQYDKMIGRDDWDSSQQRASKGTYTAEYYNLLNDLNYMQYETSDYKKHFFTPAQKRLIVKACFAHNSDNLTFYKIRKLLSKHQLGITKDARFISASPRIDYYQSKKVHGKWQREASKKIEQKTKFCQLKAIHAIQNALPSAYQHSYELLDLIGEILSKFKSDSVRKKALMHLRTFSKKTNLTKSYPWDRATISDLTKLMRKSKFRNNVIKLSVSNKPEKLSLKTMRTLIPYLEANKSPKEMHQIINKLGYHQWQKIDVNYLKNNITNPVVKRSVSVLAKFNRDLTKRYRQLGYCYPDRIHVEFSRDLSKSSWQLMQEHISNQRFHDARTTMLEKMKEKGIEPSSATIPTFKIGEQQNWMDVITGVPLAKEVGGFKNIFKNGNVQIDHIIPKSWTHNDSYWNKCLVTRKENLDKSNHIPSEYLDYAHNPNRWHKFSICVKKFITVPRKRKALLLVLHSKAEKQALAFGWQKHDLQNNQWIIRLSSKYFQQNAKFDHRKELKRSGKHHRTIITPSGYMTTYLRKRWNLPKNRIASDKHHAQDAIIIGLIDTRLINNIERLNKYDELSGSKQSQTRAFKLLAKAVNNIYQSTDTSNNGFPYPWHGFVQDVQHVLNNIFVVKKTKHTLQGEVAKDTHFGASHLNKGIGTMRCPVIKLRYNKSKGAVTGSKANQTGYLPKAKNKYAKQMNKYLTKTLKKFGTGKEAFPMGYTTWEVNNHVEAIRRVKLVIPNIDTDNIVLSKDKASFSLNGNGSIIRTDIFKDKNGVYKYVPIYLRDTVKHALPKKIATSYGKAMNILQPSDKFICSLVQNTPVKVTFKRPECKLYHVRIGNKAKYLKNERDKHGHKDSRDYVRTFVGYFKRPSVSSNQLNFIANDSHFVLKDISVRTIQHIQKLDVNMFGQLHACHMRNVHNSRKSNFDSYGRKLL